MRRRSGYGPHARPPSTHLSESSPRPACSTYEHWKVVPRSTQSAYPRKIYYARDQHEVLGKGAPPEWVKRGNMPRYLRAAEMGPMGLHYANRLPAQDMLCIQWVPWNLCTQSTYPRLAYHVWDMHAAVCYGVVEARNTHG